MSGRQMRKPAVRAFASEVGEATYQYKEDEEEERSPKLALLPTGVEANRVFFCGTLTEAEDVGSDSEYWHARVADPTDVFHVYAGQYQPEAAQVIRDTEMPEYVSVTAKLDRFELDDGGYNVTLRPENVSVTSQEVRDRWLVETAEATLDRLEKITGYEEDIEDDDSHAIPTSMENALNQYDVDFRTLRMEVRDALDQVGL
jgi:RPA family protein